MDAIHQKLECKLSKAKNNLLDLHKEIKSTLTFLDDIRQQSSVMVEKLYNISSPAMCLKEFVDVNAFLYKYINFIMEINCKFEMLQILENKNYSSTKFLTNKLANTKKSEQLKDLALCDSDQLLQCIEHKVDQVLNDRFEQVNLSSLNVIRKQPVNLQNQKDSSNCSCNSMEDTIKVTNKNLCSNLKYSGNKISLSDPNFLQKEPSQSEENVSETASYFNGKTNKKSQRSVASISLSESYLSEGNSEDSKSDNVEVSNPSVAHSLPTVKDMNNAILNDKTVGKFTLKRDDSVKNQNKACIRKLDLREEGNENFEIPQVKLLRKIGKQYEVVVEHIRSPTEFYVHLVDSKVNILPLLENLLKSIPPDRYNMKFKKIKDRKTFLMKKSSVYVLYYSKCDEFWCRAKVTDWNVNHRDDLVQIFLLDYGESKCVYLDTLCPMPEQVKKYPALALKCHLFGIRPREAKEGCGSFSWVKGSTEIMKVAIEKSKSQKIQIAWHEQGDSLAVTLWLDQGTKSVNELLIDSNQAVRMSVDTNLLPKEKYLSEDNELENWNPMREDHESYQNTYDININDPSSAIYGYIGKDYDRVCSQFSRTGKCYKGKACRKEHTFLDPSGFTTDQEEVYKNAFSELPVPALGSIINVQVTCILRVNRFYCISKHAPVDDSEEDLASLVNYMNQKENISEMRKLSIPPSTGQIVISKYSGDDAWYRAKILESQPEIDLYTVIYVDFGNKESIPQSRIRAIEARYLHLPFQAIFCFIYGVDINPEASEEDALSYLNDRMEEGNISVEVISKFPGEELCLHVKALDQHGQDIGKSLIEMGFAVLKEEITVSQNSDMLPG